MGIVDTNAVNLAYAIESALGTLPTTPDWFDLEPNNITTFGADITTVTRDPISKNRQRRKGTPVDLDSGVEFEADLTLSSWRDFVEAFIFSKAVNREVTDLPVTAATTTKLTTTLDAAQQAKFAANTLVWVGGFGTTGNNGLKATSSAATATGPTFGSGTFTAETRAAHASLAGLRTTGATWAYANNRATLGQTGVGTSLQTRGLTVGQFVHIGSVASVGSSFQNAFENTDANDMRGYARVVSISADAVVFDKLSEALKVSDSTSPTTPVDILFGEFVRNVPVDDTAYLERSFTFELEYPGLAADGSASEFQYARGNYCNSIGLNLPLSDKAVLTAAFVGLDTASPSTTRKANAANASRPLHVAAFNTSLDLARLRITETDESGLTTDFDNLTLTLANNVSPRKVLGRLGAKFMNVGLFTADMSAQLLFTNSAVISAIRENRTVTLDFILTSDDGVIAVDLPAVDLGGGGREFPRNESVLLNAEVQSHEDETLETSIGVSIIPVPLGTDE